MDSMSGSKKEMAELRAIFEKSNDPVLTAIEIAEKMQITQQAAHAKLTSANKAGWVKRKKVGSRAVVWWIENQSSESA